MAYRSILEWPHPTLKKISDPVNLQNSELLNLIKDLSDTLNVEVGLGIAAPQIGELKRVVLIDLKHLGLDNPDKDSSPLDQESIWVLLNPMLEDPEGTVRGEEGCLSVPWATASVNRHENITLKYQTVDGSAKKMRVEPPLSVALQHEIDHLDGKLYIDRVSRMVANRVKKSITKRRKKLQEVRKDLLSDPDKVKIGRPKKNSGLSKKELAKRKKNKRKNKN